MSRNFECTYLVSEKAQKLSKTAKPPTAYKLYGGSYEMFYFPLDLEIKSPGNDNGRRPFIIDPWPAFCTNKMNTTEQIYISDTARLKRQGRVESKLPIPIKPRFLMQLEEKIRSDKAKYKIPDDICSPVRLQMYREVFEMFIGGCTHYSSFLSEVKSQYDQYILHLHEKIKSLLPMRENVQALNMDCERRVMEAKEKENSDLKYLESERLRNLQTIERMKEERMELITLNEGLKEQLIKETATLQMESDGRKLSQIAANELTIRLNDMEAIVKNQKSESQEDPLKLRIALDMAHKALAVNTKKLVEFEANYESTISLTEHERVLSELEQEKRQIVKLQEDLDGYSSRYDLLQDHCSSLNTYKDLYMIQCGYTLRVLGAKGDPQQKLDYIGLLLTRWRRIIADKPMDELTKMAAEEMGRFDSGGLPSIQRLPKKDKKSMANSRRTTTPDV